MATSAFTPAARPPADSGQGCRPGLWSGAYGFDHQAALGSLFIAGLTGGSDQCLAGPVLTTASCPSERVGAVEATSTVVQVQPGARHASEALGVIWERHRSSTSSQASAAIFCQLEMEGVAAIMPGALEYFAHPSVYLIFLAEGEVPVGVLWDAGAHRWVSGQILETYLNHLQVAGRQVKNHTASSFLLPEERFPQQEHSSCCSDACHAMSLMFCAAVCRSMNFAAAPSEARDLHSALIRSCGALASTRQEQQFLDRVLLDVGGQRAVETAAKHERDMRILYSLVLIRDKYKHLEDAQELHRAAVELCELPRHVSRWAPRLDVRGREEEQHTPPTCAEKRLRPRRVRKALRVEGRRLGSEEAPRVGPFCGKGRKVEGRRQKARE